MSWTPAGFCLKLRVQFLHLLGSVQRHHLVHMPCATPKSCKVAKCTALYAVALAALQMWVGYNQSVRPCQSGLTLNVDITFAAFVKAQPLASLVAHAAGFASEEDLRRRPLNKVQVNMVNRQIRGIQVGGRGWGHAVPLKLQHSVDDVRGWQQAASKLVGVLADQGARGAFGPSQAAAPTTGSRIANLSWVPDSMWAGNIPGCRRA